MYNLTLPFVTAFDVLSLLLSVLDFEANKANILPISIEICIYAAEIGKLSGKADRKWIYFSS